MVAVDTNVISLLLRGQIDLNLNSQLFVPYVVLAELKSGIAAGDNPNKHNKILDDFLSGKDIVVSSGLGAEVINTYVEIYSYLRNNGTPVSPNDLWIAAECMYLSLSLLSKDKDFEKIPQIQKAQYFNIK